MEALIDTFNLDWKIIVAQLINFAIVFLVLYKFALKPLAKLMDERKQKIAQGLTDAQINAQKALEIERLYQEELNKARMEAQNLLHQMKADIENKKEILLRDSHAEAQALILNTQNQLQAQKTQMINEAKKEIGKLVIESVEKILDQSLDLPTKEKLTKESISKI